nr:hypothetical protein [Trinickia violacea]
MNESKVEQIGSDVRCHKPWYSLRGEISEDKSASSQKVKCDACEIAAYQREPRRTAEPNEQCVDRETKDRIERSDGHKPRDTP